MLQTFDKNTDATDIVDALKRDGGEVNETDVIEIAGNSNSEPLVFDLP